MQVERGDERIVHLEQQAQPVALARQLLLVNLGVLRVQRVIHRHGHLRRNLLEKFKVGGIVSTGLNRTEPHRSDSAMRCR